jgi:hypothetical protein
MISLGRQNPVVRFLAFAHVIGIITYKIYRESFCLDFLPQSKNFSTLHEVQLRIVGLDHFSRNEFFFF